MNWTSMFGFSPEDGGARDRTIAARLFMKRGFCPTAARASSLAPSDAGHLAPGRPPVPAKGKEKIFAAPRAPGRNVDGSPPDPFPFELQPDGLPEIQHSALSHELFRVGTHGPGHGALHLLPDLVATTADGRTESVGLVRCGPHHLNQDDTRGAGRPVDSQQRGEGRSEVT